VAVRRALYRSGLLRFERLPVPVIVIGNITAGGTGKTPLVSMAFELSRVHGMRPGIVSRGYGAAAREPRGVTPDSEPDRVGDEPLMLAQRCDCPVWVGANTARGGPRAARAHPKRDVIVSDDGLQHYGLARDVEIVVTMAHAVSVTGYSCPRVRCANRSRGCAKSTRSSSTARRAGSPRRKTPSACASKAANSAIS
jgi:tetraacyldisaccharide 4'-kinase